MSVQVPLPTLLWPSVPGRIPNHVCLPHLAEQISAIDNDAGVVFTVSADFIRRVASG